MDFANIPITVQVAVLVAIAALFIIVASFKLPQKYYANEKARNEIRMRLREKAYEAKQPKSEETTPENDRNSG
jgi:hypothetical protein